MVDTKGLKGTLKTMEQMPAKRYNTCYVNDYDYQAIFKHGLHCCV